jgi:hypothetical protein
MAEPQTRRVARPPADPHDAARRLADLVRETSLSCVLRQAFLLRLSRLPPDRAQPHHLALASEALAPLLVADRAKLFRLANYDAAVVWRGDATAELHDSIAAIRHLFADDGGAVPDPDALFAHLHLPRDAGVLLAAITASMQPPRRPQYPPSEAALPLDIAALAGLESGLVQASMDRFARRRPICTLKGDHFHRAWEHRFLSTDELFETLLPNHAPHADPWLFRRLTRTLDRRLLALFASAEELRRAVGFSFDLNIASLLSPEFLRFDAALATELRGQIVLNLRPEDIMSDPANFLFARDFATARGYRLLLHGIRPAHLPLLSLTRLGLDFVQLPPEIVDHPGAPLPDPARIVLGGTDAPAILAWGRARGITLYKGLLAAPQIHR